jgi:integrase
MTWQLVVEAERDAEGRRVQLYRPFHGEKADAQRALRAFLSEVETGFTGDADQLTVSEYLERWLQHTTTRVRPGTVARYRQLLQRCVAAPAGSLKLRELRPMHIQRIYEQALKTGNERSGGALAARTVNHLHRALFAAMKQARKWGLIVSNPCESVEPPRAVNREMRSLNESESRKLMAAAKGTRLYVPIVLSLSVGLRRGECLGLGWDAVDFPRGVIRISRSLQPDGKFSEPKTARSRRSVALPAFAIAALKAHKVAQNADRLAAGSSYADNGLVFADAFGAAWKPASITTLFHGICKRAGIGHVRFHDLRHTAASLMIERGVSITTVALLLGHANTSTTLSTYAHAIKGAEEAGARAMDALFKGIETAG